jgi:hypothetical protein
MRERIIEGVGPGAPWEGVPVKIRDAAGEAAGGAGKSGLVLKDEYRRESWEFWPRPSELELATLAARLARTEKLDAKQLVNEAWSLYWASCRKIQEDHVATQKAMQDWMWEEEIDWEAAEGLAQPKEYPMTFDEMGRLLLPHLKGRTGERAAVFREYALADLLRAGLRWRGGFRRVSYWEFSAVELAGLKEEHQEEIVQRFGAWRARRYDAVAYQGFASSFLTWYRKWRERRKGQVREANARKGWEKRRKAKRAKTGARPKTAALKEILKQSLKKA